MSADELLIADTNNHRILRLNPQTGAWKELMIDGLSALGAITVTVDPDAMDAGSPVLAAKELHFQFKIPLPLREHFTPGAPISLKLTDEKSILYTATLWAPPDGATTAPLSAIIPPEALATKPPHLFVTLYYTRCSTGPSAVCTPDKAAWKVSPTFAPSGVDQLTLTR